MTAAEFRFHGALNDFLPPACRHRALEQPFERRASLKDVIEALGVPHPEVSAITVDGRAAGFETLLAPGSHVEVYPFDAHPMELPALRSDPPRPPRFVLDVHLGRLARYLRLLGFDTHYYNDSSDTELAELSAEEGRILLSRDRGLLKRRIVEYGQYLHETAPTRQVEEVCARWRLQQDFAPFTRCVRCNSELKAVDKADISDRLEPGTRREYEQFWQCPCCGQLYWRGSHFERMRQWIDALGARWD